MRQAADTANLDDVIEGAEQDFRTRAECQGVTDARRADELAADLAREHGERHGFGEDSDEREAILSALCALAGRMFPGQWDDYPRR